jgi:hypothetical protein
MQKLDENRNPDPTRPSRVLTLLSTLSTSRQAPGSQPPAVSTVSPTPDPSKHSAVCCCTLCEQRGTGELAMRSVGGDYQRFLARVGSLPSSLLSRLGWRDAASSLLAVVGLLLPRRST